MEGESITIDVADLLANDYDVDGDDIILDSIINVDDGHGTAVLSEDGKTITFTPDADYNGEAIFSYTVNDGEATSNEAKVFLDVKPDGEPTVFVGTMCNADVQSHDIARRWYSYQS